MKKVILLAGIALSGLAVGMENLSVSASSEPTELTETRSSYDFSGKVAALDERLYLGEMLFTDADWFTTESYECSCDGSQLCQYHDQGGWPEAAEAELSIKLQPGLYRLNLIEVNPYWADWSFAEIQSDTITNLSGVSINNSDTEKWFYVESGSIYNFEIYFTDVQAATDDRDESILFTRYDLIDAVAPTINATVHVSVNVDNQPSIDEILSHVTAVDETDGVVPVLVESSTYTQGQMIVGDYEIHIYAQDQAGNRANKIIYVHRYDDTKPVISGQNSYVLNYDHSVTKDSILASLSVADNVDSGLTITCVADTFSGHEHTIGTYQLEFQTTDLSGIQSDVFTVTVKVENQGTPTITAPGTIEIGTSQLLSLEELKEKISVNDGYDGVITDYQISGYDNYLSHYQEVGTYSITISYTNSGGNQATTTISIVTSDQLAPGIYFDDYFILLKVGESFPESTLKAQVARVLKVAESEILEISGTYDTDVVGTYPLSVKTTSGDYDFSVKVSSMSDEEESDKNYFVELWEQTVRSFKNPFDFGGYTWLSWTFVVVGVLLILLVIKGVLKARRR